MQNWDKLFYITCKNKGFLFLWCYILFFIFFINYTNEVSFLTDYSATYIMFWGILIWLGFEFNGVFTNNIIQQFLVNLTYRTSYLFYYIALLFLISVAIVLLNLLGYGVAYLIKEEQILFSYLIAPSIKSLMVLCVLSYLLLLFTFYFQSFFKAFVFFYVYQILEQIINKILLKFNFEFNYLPLKFLETFFNSSITLSNTLLVLSFCLFLIYSNYYVFSKKSY